MRSQTDTSLSDLQQTMATSDRSGTWMRHKPWAAWEVDLKKQEGFNAVSLVEPVGRCDNYSKAACGIIALSTASGLL